MIFMKTYNMTYKFTISTFCYYNITKKILSDPQNLKWVNKLLNAFDNLSLSEFINDFFNNTSIKWWFVKNILFKISKYLTNKDLYIIKIIKYITMVKMPTFKTSNYINCFVIYFVNFYFIIYFNSIWNIKIVIINFEIIWYFLF